jgi:hypothetical protein
MQELTQLIKPSLILENTTFKQSFGVITGRDDSRCALGVIFGNRPQDVYGQWDELDKFLGVGDEGFRCPCCVQGGEAHLSGVIVHLNDHHKLTFKEIAVWLRSIGY